MMALGLTFPLNNSSMCRLIQWAKNSKEQDLNLLSAKQSRLGHFTCNSCFSAVNSIIKEQVNILVLNSCSSFYFCPNDKT